MQRKYRNILTSSELIFFKAFFEGLKFTRKGSITGSFSALSFHLGVSIPEGLKLVTIVSVFGFRF